MESRYENPVHRGDFPDPSVIRITDSDFYAVTTSTEWAPFFPIFHSSDLVTWTRCGSVFLTRPTWAVGQFWAPEISFHDGTYFVYYTARRRGGPLTIGVATASHPRGPWTDCGPLVGQPTGSIDATTAVEDGMPWLVWKEDGNASGVSTTLWAQRLACDGRTLEGSPYPLMRNDVAWEDDVIEAPSIVERDGWFYLFYSGNRCCGETCGYAVGVARARSLVGPWTKCPQNPILAGNAEFRGPGHGSVVTTDDSGTWFLYHAYENAAGATRLGRELMLDEIEWDHGWPSVNRGQGPSVCSHAPFPTPGTSGSATFHADVTSLLESSWQWPQDRNCSASIDPTDRVIVVETGSSPQTSRGPLAAAIAQPARSLDYAATAVLEIAGLDPRIMASLVAYGDRRNALGVGVCSGRIVAWILRNGHYNEKLLGHAGTARELHLRLDAIWGKAFRVSFSPNGQDWADHADVLDGTYLPPWDRGVRIALAAGGKARQRVRWTGFHIEKVV